jgi:Fe-S-cluster-containing dehydrogenase component
MQYGFVLDHRKCIGCHACTVACKAENDVPVGSFRTWVKYTEIGEFPQVRRHFAVLRCNQCTSAPCVTICPVTALHKRPDGIVDLDRDVCIGCKACMQACPYDALYLNEDTGAAEKCHFCAHRVEQGLKPACEIVCPVEAIISGDLDDPQSRVSELRQVPGAQVRRPEQGTGPNVWYLGTDPVSLHPGRAAEPTTYLWSERRYPPPPLPASATSATTTLNANHPIHWRTRVEAYLVTKGIAGGAAMLAPFAEPLGLAGDTARFLPEAVALAFIAATSALLVADLKRPFKFWRMLTRPNTRSWLVKGALVITAFSAAAAAALAARALGADAVADALRWLGLPLGAATAGYTAWLFAQCEGRDLWQNKPILLPHLLVQAIALGGAALSIAAPTAALATVTALAAVCHLLAVAVETTARHGTENARQAASLLRAVPAVGSVRLSALMAGVIFVSIPAIALLLAARGGHVTAALTCVTALQLAAGVFFWERAYVRAGQMAPLS